MFTHTDWQFYLKNKSKKYKATMKYFGITECHEEKWKFHCLTNPAKQILNQA